MARVSCTARAVSLTSDEVMPWCRKRASGPTISVDVGQEGDDVVLGLALDLVDAVGVEDRVAARSQIAAAAALGITPSSAMASAAWASISNMMRKRVCGDQMAAASGRA